MTFGGGLGRPGAANAIGVALLGAATAGLGSPASAAGTIAGTNIANTATATYDLPDGSKVTVTSNIVSLTIDELLDVSVVRTTPGDVSTTPGAINQLLSFTVTNAGNGSERFALATRQAIGGDAFDPSVTSVVLDSNGNGAYDAGVDTVYVAGGNDPLLAPDASIGVFVLSLIPAGARDGDRGQADLTAVAATGSGAPGTSFAGLGQGGGNAVVGATALPAENRNPAVADRIAVTLQSGDDHEHLTLVETEPDSGRFVGAIGPAPRRLARRAETAWSRPFPARH